MRKLFFICYTLLFFQYHPMAQYATVNYDYELNRFGQNEPLPSETPLLFTGTVPTNTDIVELAVFNSKGKDERDPLAVATWKRPFDNNATAFNLPLNYKLQSSKEYDLRIGFYREIGEQERSELRERLFKNLDNYIDRNLKVKEDRIKLEKRPKRMVKGLNEVVSITTAYYRSRIYNSFDGFSELVEQKLCAIQDDKLKESQQVIEEGEAPEKRRQYRSELISELKSLVHAEVQFLLDNDIAILNERRFIDNYPTEKRSNHFALNAGYGGVWLDDKLDDESAFGSSPYLGLGFPLSTSTIAPKFFRNSSITLGFFVNNFEDDAGNKVSGPVFNRPIYAGLDYKLFSFVRFNVGAVLLERQGRGDAGNDIFVRPFVGISAKINLSVGLD